MTKKRLFIDMDGTLARFHDQVNYLERMFEKEFFRSLEPFENMVSGLQLFMQNNPSVEVYSVSAKVKSDPAYCEEEKNIWLDTYMPQIDREHRIFSDIGYSKAEYIPGGVTKNDFLLDDYNRGLNLFLYDGGSVIKCHNNINQRGLGRYGGSAGHMWMGPMVHTDDKPEMIAAEIGRHMGLDYDLHQVLSAYPEISFIDAREHDRDYIPGFTKHIKQTADGRFLAVAIENGEPGYWGFSDPLNAIRFLEGDEDFREYLLKTNDGLEISATALELRSVCFNVYQSAYFQKFLRADRAQLADDVVSARAAAKKPIIGQVNYLSCDGTVGYSTLFFSHEKMQAEIMDCKDCGRPITEEWFIPPRQKTFPELTDIGQMVERLYNTLDFTEDEAYQVSKVLLRPYSERTEAQMLDLVSAWHEHQIPDRLQSFLRLTDEEMQDFMRGASHYKLFPSLESMIRDADERAAAQTSGPAPFSLDRDEV